MAEPESPPGMGLSPQGSVSGETKLTNETEICDSLGGEANLSTLENSVVTSTSTIASNPSTIVSNPSLVWVEQDDDQFLSRCMDRSFGWIDLIPLPCGGEKNSHDDNGPQFDKNKSLLYNSKQSPYSSRLYKNRRRGNNRNRSTRYLARFAQKEETEEAEETKESVEEEKEEISKEESLNEIKTVTSDSKKDIDLMKAPSFRNRVRSVVQRKPRDGKTNKKTRKKKGLLNNNKKKKPKEKLNTSTSKT